LANFTWTWWYGILAWLLVEVDWPLVSTKPSKDR
jgi:hypothetical protein